MNDDPFLRGMSKTQKSGFSYGQPKKNFASVDPNSFGTYADDIMNNNSKQQNEQTQDLNVSYREQQHNSTRLNDESFNQSEWDNADTKSNFNDSAWNYGSEYGSESNYSQSNYSYHGGNQGMDTSNYGGHNSSQHQESANDVDKAAKQQFLVNEVANKGYDQEAFSNYLKSLKGNDHAINIDNWSLFDLQNAVKKFVRFDKKQIEYYRKKSAASAEDTKKKMEERKAKRKAKALSSKFNIDPISENKSKVDKNPFRKKELPKVTSPFRESIREENKLERQEKEEKPDKIIRKQKKSKIGAFSKKQDAMVKASKYQNLPTFENIDDEDGYDSELDSNASLRENACLGNIFIMQELPVMDNYDYEVSFVEGEYRPLEAVMQKQNTVLQNLDIKKESQSVDKTQKKQLTFLEDVQRNRLKKIKTTMNKEKYVQIDETFQKNVFSTPDMKIFCAITGSKVRELNNFGIFRSRVIIFQFRTKLQIGEKKKVYKVRRYESDFYLLRSILAMSFGQCMIPCINPKKIEVSFDKKGISFREKFFSRFLRGVLRSPEIRNHPTVLEFFKVDHFKDGGNTALKQFTMTLEKQKADLVKQKSTYLNSYKISSVNTRIPIQPEFTEENLEREHKGLTIDAAKFNEAYFVDKYEKIVGKIMGEIKKYSKQYGGLMKSYKKMQTTMSKVTDLHARYEEDLESEIPHKSQYTNEEAGMQNHQFSNCSDLFDKQTTEIEEMYGKQYNLLYNHFKHQSEVVTESVKPFLGKIAAADKKHEQSLVKFYTQRESQMAQFKTTCGLTKLEEVLTHNATFNDDEKSQQYYNAMYSLYLDIEKSKEMSSDNREVEKSESFKLYTRNQFYRQFRSLMENDESKTLKYQMIYVGKIWDENLLRMEGNCRLFEDAIHQGHFMPNKEALPMAFSDVDDREDLDQFQNNQNDFQDFEKHNSPNSARPEIMSPGIIPKVDSEGEYDMGFDFGSGEKIEEPIRHSQTYQEPVQNQQSYFPRASTLAGIEDERIKQRDLEKQQQLDADELQKQLDDELKRQAQAMMMERDNDEPETLRITSDHIIRESEERKAKEAASDEKQKRLSQQHDEELRLSNEKVKESSEKSKESDEKIRESDPGQ